MALKGIVIDPGHGGSDSGAVSNSIKEIKIGQVLLIPFNN